MRSSLVLASVTTICTALANPRLHKRPLSSVRRPIAPQTTSASDQPSEFAPAQVSTQILTQNAPHPSSVATLDGLTSEDTASWTTITTSIIIGDGGPDLWFPFSWGPWMLPPLEDITCSVTSASVPNWDSPDFPWIIPPRNHLRTEAPTSASIATLAEWTESASGSWGFQPREGVTCVGTSSTSTFSLAPIWGGGGTSFFWGLPPRDHVSTEALLATPTAALSDYSTIFVTVVSTATSTSASERRGGVMSTLASGSDREGQIAAMTKQLDVTTVTNTETDVVTATVVPAQLSESTPRPSSMPSPTEINSDPLPVSTSHKAIPTLSATKEPDIVTASSAWVSGLPPPIPFDSVIVNTLTLNIPDHGTTVADTSTWFGPWPSSTEMPFVTSPIVIQTTPTTFLTLPKTTDIIPSATSFSSIECNEEYCGEDGTSYCFYWAGITAMGQHGPEPGETRIPLGACSVSAVSTTPVAAPGRQSGPPRILL